MRCSVQSMEKAGKSEYMESVESSQPRSIELLRSVALTPWSELQAVLPSSTQLTGIVYPSSPTLK